MSSKRVFKTLEEREQERQEALGLIQFKMPTDKILLIYARQSTKGQVVKNRESAEQQTVEQIDRAIELGWPEDRRLLFIENQAKDGTIRNASGTLRIDEREGLSAVMTYINGDEASAVMARDVARFFRDEDLVGPVVFAKACREHHVLVMTDDYTYDFNHHKRGRDDYKRFIQEAQAAADFLDKHIRGVMHKNRDRKAKRGEFFGHTIPVGYMLNEDRTFYVPNPYHAKPMKELFKRFRALGGNPATLRREIVGKPIFPDLPPEILDRIGRLSLTKVPDGWTIKSSPGLTYILTNPVYIGHIFYKGQIVKKNAHTAIVDEDDFWFAYYRLASTDFEGNPIERPEGVTKRYQHKENVTKPTLFSGLRVDGTPVITTNMSDRASVYTKPSKSPDYVIVDRSHITPLPHVARIRASKLDKIFSERLHHRVGEALRNSGEYPLDDDTAKLEKRRHEIHTQMILALDDAEKTEGEQPDPLETLRSSIAETQKAIVERERVSEVATHVMDSKDLIKHFESLKKLRRALAEMEQKLNQVETEEKDEEEAKGKLPEVYERWAQMSIESRLRFIRVATKRIILDELKRGWLRLTVEWSPILGGSLVDEAYIWNFRESSPEWSEEEEKIMREMYETTPREQLMKLLPQRSWDAIHVRSEQLRLFRGHKHPHFSAIPSTLVSFNDWMYIQELDFALEELLEKRVIWVEHIGLPVVDNKEGSCLLP